MTKDEKPVSVRVTKDGTTIATYADGHTVSTGKDRIPLNTFVRVHVSRESVSVQVLDGSSNTEVAS